VDRLRDPGKPITYVSYPLSGLPERGAGEAASLDRTWKPIGRNP
jgi:hypothetical protein